VKKIKLTQGQYALVDDTDFEELNQYKWFAAKDGDTGKFYAVRSISRIHEIRKYGAQRISMHRQILGLPAFPGDKRKGDHREPDHTLDNRRNNLRRAGSEQNNMNKRKQSNNTTGFKGVTFRSSSGMFIAQIQSQGKMRHLGVRKTAKAASKLYEAAAKELHGEFARVA
jgi:hypothetical protein